MRLRLGFLTHLHVGANAAAERTRRIQLGNVAHGYFPPGRTQEEYFTRTHIHYGHPEQVVDSLRADLVLPLTTELICQVHPGHPTPDQILTALERIANEVAPALGWRNEKAA